MKSLFRGYYKLTSEEINEVWKKGFISLDTNVLFNFYRYSENTRIEIFRVLKTFGNQLWLPYNVAQEFHKGRIEVIAGEVKTYEDAIKNFSELEKSILQNKRSPHLSDSIVEAFKNNFKACVEDLGAKRDFYNKLLHEDAILSEITELFDGKVGKPMNAEEIKLIEKEGEERYKNKVPPGYEDAAKQTNKFGDLFIWKQLIARSKETAQPFIFISDDIKDDWWLRSRGQSISPRPELQQELFEFSGQILILYTSDRFLDRYSESTKGHAKVEEAVIEEVRSVGSLPSKAPENENDRLNRSVYEKIVTLLLSKEFNTFNKFNNTINSQDFKDFTKNAQMVSFFHDYLHAMSQKTELPKIYFSIDSLHDGFNIDNNLNEESKNNSKDNSTNDRNHEENGAADNQDAPSL
ncbi:hypothetical protein EGT74_06660 [Chitinophaga lutea]|uniref:PIN like domain-containing protein n=1 Tax=Chitinophaga lutea TaxID=2488634 RepID=A0A3N4QB50_9BACT|nr:PIN domain-containing protein [Chitinophaga lutea]RPE13207.1 hypothetical protein EGT74_06660 [Chitinophaga lutea]